jgi:hypothetical protein
MTSASGRGLGIARRRFFSGRRGGPEASSSEDAWDTAAEKFTRGRGKESSTSILRTPSSVERRNTGGDQW